MDMTHTQLLNFIRKKKEEGRTEPELTRSTRYYLRQFDLKGDKKFVYGWNWAAFLAGPAWMIYRGMYLHAFAYMIISRFLNKILLHFLPQDLEYNVIAILGEGLLMIWVGIIGTGLYLNFIDSKIKKGIFHRPPTGWSLFLAILLPLGVFIAAMMMEMLHIHA